MYIVTGGTGRVGSAVADRLIGQGMPVTVVGHDPAKAEEWQQRGACFACVDIMDSDALRDVLREGGRAFLLNPPADPSTDTDAQEKKTIAALLAAIEGSELERIVAASTYGAQPGERMGDSSTLYEFEQGLAQQDIPYIIQRGAYYYSNWDMSLQSAREFGTIQSFFAEDFVLPMVSPSDLGRNAARLLAGVEFESGAIVNVEGPERYAAADVAKVFSEVLARSVTVEVIEQNDQVDAYRAIGFSNPAAESYAEMTRVTAETKFLSADEAVRGSITLYEHIRALAEGELARA